MAIINAVIMDKSRKILRKIGTTESKTNRLFSFLDEDDIYCFSLQYGHVIPSPNVKEDLVKACFQLHL